MIDTTPPAAPAAAMRTGRRIPEETALLIDCNTCIARDVACRDCVITVLLERPALVAEPDLPPPVGLEPVELDDVELDDVEREALASLAYAGLIAPLRLVRAVSEPRSGIRESA